MPTNDEIERILEKYTKEIRNQAAGKEILEKVERMFSTVLAAVSDLRQHTDNGFAGLHQDVKGLQGRVTVLEQRPKASIAPQQVQALSSYKVTDTGSFVLQDFEMHEIHLKAKRWDTITGWIGKVSVIVAAAVVVSLLVWLGWIRK